MKKLKPLDVKVIEKLAKLLHESGRKAVESGRVVNKIPGQPFYGWYEITPAAREGRRMMAIFLLDRRRRAAVKALFK